MSGPHHHHPQDHPEPPSDLVLRVRALASLLVEKGLIDPAAVDLLIDAYESKIGPRNGARVVAHAWSDPAFKTWLLKDATMAIASLDYTGRRGEHMKGGRGLSGTDPRQSKAHREGTGRVAATVARPAPTESVRAQLGHTARQARPSLTRQRTVLNRDGGGESRGWSGLAALHFRVCVPLAKYSLP